MKKILEIVFVFIICLASFFAGWVMSLKYQEGLSWGKASLASSENPAFSKTSKENPPRLTLGETSLTNLPPSDLSSLPSENPSHKAETKEVKSLKSPPAGKLPEPAAVPEEQKEIEQREKKGKPSLSDLEKKRKDKFDKLNQKAFYRIKNRQNVFNERGQFSFLINVFSKEEEAMEYVQKLRGQFPLWGFFLKPDQQNLRVYLGPFLTKARAADFIKALPDPKPFPNYFLETEGL